MEKQSKSLAFSLFLIIVTIELSFVPSNVLNIFVLVVGFLYLLWKKQWGVIGATMIVPLFPAIGSYWSIRVQGIHLELASVMFTRTFAFALLGFLLAFSVDLEELLLVLEQKGLPPHFVYGLLVIIHAFPYIRREVVQMKEASQLRGRLLHFWSSLYYIKVIFTAYHLQEQYEQAMISHGFDEKGKRTPSIIWKNDGKALGWMILLFVVGNSIGWLWR